MDDKRLGDLAKSKGVSIKHMKTLKNRTPLAANTSTCKRSGFLLENANKTKKKSVAFASAMPSPTIWERNSVSDTEEEEEFATPCSQICSSAQIDPQQSASC
jgi:hypothetical protein